MAPPQVTFVHDLLGAALLSPISCEGFRKSKTIRTPLAPKHPGCRLAVFIETSHAKWHRRESYSESNILNVIRRIKQKKVRLDKCTCEDLGCCARDIHVLEETQYIFLWIGAGDRIADSVGVLPLQSGHCASPACGPS